MTRLKVDRSVNGLAIRNAFYAARVECEGGRIVSLACADGRELIYGPRYKHDHVRGGVAKELECGFPGQMAGGVFQQDVLPSDGQTCRVRYTYHGRPGAFMRWSMKQVKTFTFRADSPVIRVEQTLQNVGEPELFAAFRIHNELVSSAGGTFIVPTVEGLLEIPAETPASRFVPDFTAGLAGVWWRNTREAVLFLPDYDTVDKFLFSGDPNRATAEWYCRSFSIGHGGSWSSSYLILPTRLDSLDRLPSVLSAAGLDLDVGRRDRRPQAAMAVRPGRPASEADPVRFFQRTAAGLVAREAAMTNPCYGDNVPLSGGGVCSRVIDTRPGAGFEVTLPDDETVAVEAECFLRIDGPGQVEAYLGCCDPEGNLHAVSVSATLDFWRQTATVQLPVGELAGKTIRLFLFGKDVQWPRVSLVSTRESRSLFASLRVWTPGAEEPTEMDTAGKVPLEFVATGSGKAPCVECWTLSRGGKGARHRTLRMQEGRRAPLLQESADTQGASVAGALPGRSSLGEGGRAPQAQGEATPQFSVRIPVPANTETAYRVTAGSESVEGTVCRSGYFAAQGLPRGAIHFYVSPLGQDSFSGTRAAPNAGGSDGPFATVDRARQAVRTLKRRGELKRPVVVTIRGGTYELAEPLVFTPEDSGTAASPVLYTSHPGETVVLSGGRKVVGPWQPAGNGVLTCRIAGRAKGAPPIRQFFVEGKRVPRARVPREGFFHMGAFADASFRRVFYSPADLRGVRGLKHADLLLYFVWNEGRRRLVGLDEKKGILTLDTWVYSPLTPDRYIVENAPDGLGDPGSWCFDPMRSEVSWHPGEGVRPDTVEAVVPVLRELVRFQGREGKPVRHITLRGITFAHSDWFELDSGKQSSVLIGSALSMEHAELCGLQGNRIVNVGTYGVGLYKGCRGNLVVGNEIAGAGAGGIRIGGEELDETTRQNAVIGNEIHDCCQVYPSGIGVWIGQSSGNLLLRNHIHHLPYTGISVGWTWGAAANTHKRNRIDGNTVERVMQLLHDGGAIYLLGVSYGTTVMNNTIRDVEGGFGVYLDEGNTGTRVGGNVISRCGCGFGLHGARDALIENNVAADMSQAMMYLTNCQSYTANNRFQRNTFRSSNDVPLMIAGGWTSRFVIESGENSFFRADGKAFRIEGVPGIATLEDWIAAGYETKTLASHEDAKAEAVQVVGG